MKTFNCFVSDMCAYVIGDTISVCDTVSAVTYEQAANRTILEFQTKYGTAYWPFDGDLRARFQTGQQVMFKFSVVADYTDEECAVKTVNYFQAAMAKLYHQDQVLDINSYLKENPQ